MILGESAFSVFLFISLFSGVLGAAFLAVVMFAENRTILLEHDVRVAKLESERRGAQIRALQAQIDPHFVHNTLGALIALVKTRRNDKALSGLYALSKMLRYKYRVGEMIPLAHELDYTRNYLFLQSSRFGPCIESEISVSEQILDASFPTLSLQTIVENVFQHAWTHSTDTLIISVTGRLTEDKEVLIEVVDNGRGISPEDIKRFYAAQEGHDEDWTENHIGLLNVHRRMQLHFGESYGVSLKTPNTGGTLVILRFPYMVGTIST